MSAQIANPIGRHSVPLLSMSVCFQKNIWANSCGFPTRCDEISFLIGDGMDAPDCMPAGSTKTSDNAYRFPTQTTTMRAEAQRVAA